MCSKVQHILTTHPLSLFLLNKKVERRDCKRDKIIRHVMTNEVLPNGEGDVQFDDMSCNPNFASSTVPTLPFCITGFKTNVRRCYTASVCDDMMIFF